MYSDVLIGVDHHDGGRDAVALAQQWFAHGAGLTLAHMRTTRNGARGAKTGQ